MSDARKDGGSAFPFISWGMPNGVVVSKQDDGMSLRDWFAGQAISSLVAKHRADLPWSQIGPTAYSIADAMLEAREK